MTKPAARWRAVSSALLAKTDDLSLWGSETGTSKRTIRHERWKLASVEVFCKKILLTLLGSEFHSKSLKDKITTTNAVFLVYWICIHLFKYETETLCYTSWDWTPACCCMCSLAGLFSTAIQPFRLSPQSDSSDHLHDSTHSDHLR